MNRFRTGQGPCRAILHKWGLAPNHLPVIVAAATDHEPHCRQVPINKFEGGLNLLHEAP